MKVLERIMNFLIKNGMDKIKKILLLLLLPFALLGQKQVIVHLETDNYPSETYWIFMKDSLYGDTIAMVSAGHYDSANTSYADTVMLADSIY